MFFFIEQLLENVVDHSLLQLPLLREVVCLLLAPQSPLCATLTTTGDHSARVG